MKNYYGVVESSSDPKQLGSVKVRVLGDDADDFKFKIKNKNK